jgi:NifU-like protein
LLSFVIFVYLVSPVYPKNVAERLRAIRIAISVQNADATGVAVALECGTNIKFYLTIDDSTRKIREIGFHSNGCGYMLAAADAIVGFLTGENLTQLHGLKPRELTDEIKSVLNEWPIERRHCVATVVDAIRDAFADYRRTRINEFVGERALICTCFGVSEEKIENVIRNRNARTVDDVGRLTNAGTGCGSCQMLIRELIDSAAESSN